MNLYEFYVDGDKFYDVRIDELALIDPVLELTVNAAGTFTFTIPPGHPKYSSFSPLKSTIEIYRDGEWFWEGRVIDENRDFYNKKEITVEGALGYLNDSYQPQHEFDNVTPISYVERILNVHNSQVPENRKIKLGAVTVRDPNNSVYRYTNYNNSLLELKEDIIDDLGGYLRIRKTNGELYLDVLEEYGRTCSQAIRIGENLIDLAPEFDYSDIASVIVPLGATLEDQEEHEEGLENLDKYVTIEEVNDGKEYIARQDLLDSYGQIWQVVHFNNIHTPQGLLEKAENYLTDGQWGEMVIEAKAFDLNYTDEQFQEFRLGDRVRVNSELHGIDRYFPLTSQTICFNDVANNTITLGGTGEPVSITGVTNSVTISTQKLDERVKDPNRLIQQAIYQATQLITQGLNGYVRVNGNEILIMDTDDPETAKHVWRWNMGGLGYSNNGYNGPFETAMTMDGTIVGKFLAANSVAAEQIDVNYTSHMEQQISDAESNANDYTDGKLKDYWTYKEVETQLKTTADSIIGSVNSTLTGYYTQEQVKAQLSITEGNIKSYVGDTLTAYSTTNQVQSMIDQMAGSITLSVQQNYTTKDDFGEMMEEMKSVQQTITPDGIFTIINNGIAGTERIYNTKFEMTRSGLTVQGGGITIKDNSGKNVFYADTSGNLTMLGDFLHYGKTAYKAVGITDHEVQIYAWNDTGNYVGSLGAVRTYQEASLTRVGLWSDWGDDVVIGTKYDSARPEISEIIRVGSSGREIGIKFIQGTLSSGTIPIGDSDIVVKNGLITQYTDSVKSSMTYWLANGYLTFSHGMLTQAQQNIGASGSIHLGDGSATVSNGFVTKIDERSAKSDTFWIGGSYLTFSHGMCTTWSNGSYSNGYFNFGGATVGVTSGMITSVSSGSGTSDTMRLGGGYVYFSGGLCTGWQHTFGTDQSYVVNPGGVINFTDGIATSCSGGTSGQTVNYYLPGNGRLSFTNGMLTSSTGHGGISGRIDLGNGYAFNFTNGILTSTQSPR